MRPLSALALAASLLATFAALAPTAAADSCRSAIAEETTCPPVMGVYCTLYWAATKQGTLVGCVQSAIPGVPPIVLP